MQRYNFCFNYELKMTNYFFATNCTNFHEKIIFIFNYPFSIKKLYLSSDDFENSTRLCIIEKFSVYLHF